MFPKINSVSDLSSMTEAEKDELLVRFSRKHHYLVDSVINLQEENKKLIRENEKFRVELFRLSITSKLTNNATTRDVELPEPKSQISRQQPEYDLKDFCARLATDIRAIPGEPGFERSIKVLKKLLNAARTIDDSAPIVKMLENDISNSKPTNKGFSMGIDLASSKELSINARLVQYLLVPLAGSGKQGRSVEFACRQFEFSVRKKLYRCSCLRFTESNYLEAVAAGVFYSERKDSKSRAAYAVSEELWSAGLTTIAEDNLTEVRNLINSREKGDTGEFEKIKDALSAKHSIPTKTA